MCNEKCKNQHEHEGTLNILLYRIDKIEEERRRENKDIMNLLHNIQEGQTEINKELAVHDTKISGMLEDIETLKNDKVDFDQFNVVNKRLDIYKNILMAIAGGVGVSLLIEFFKII